ncbi:hypothetical protein [Pseudomonas bubulae]|uniref:hypothetical protein n=1 Tax=Pseudomonas bubulae TaxID=2316085 RepID=UPI001F3BC875|nr:hypothetical protein [Pseudomonas bubulae]MCF3191486.1 hypothetical protein [Pseudomonas bubulae]
MSPILTIFLLIAGWLAVAGAMLWGLMRISRHHPPQVQAKPQEVPEKPLTGALEKMSITR